MTALAAAPAHDQETVKANSRVLFEKLASDDVGMQKQAEVTLNSITRLMIREDGFYRQMMQPMNLPASELTRDWRTTHHVKVEDLEPRSPAAMTIPIAGAPMSLYIRANRYPIMMRRYSTYKFAIDVAELLTWHADLRAIISDNSIKDLQAEEDSNFVIAMNRCVVGADTVVPTSGVIQYKTISGPIDRDSWAEAMAILPSTPSSLNPEYVLINNVSIWELCKMTPVEIGEQISSDIAKRGWTMTELMGRTIVVTIKKGLVPNRNIYLLAAKDCVGKAYSVEDVTMHVKKDGHMVSFYSTCYGGAGIGNTSGVGRAYFDG